MRKAPASVEKINGDGKHHTFLKKRKKTSPLEEKRPFERDSNNTHLRSAANAQKQTKDERELAAALLPAGF